MDPDPWNETAGDGAGGRLSSADIRGFGARIARRSQARLPLDQGLGALADELPHGRLTRTLREVSRQLHAGAPLEEALAGLEGRLPAHLRGLVAAGLRSGALGEVLERYAQQRRVTTELRRKVATTLFYPGLLLTGALLLVLLSARFIVPGMEAKFRDFDLRLPQQTEFLLWLSNDAAWALWSGLLALPAFAAAVRFAEHSVILGRLVCEIPGLGLLWQWIGLAEWSRLLGLLLEQQVSLPQALLLTAEGVSEARLGTASREVAARVEAGGDLGAAVAAQTALPATLARMVDWAHRRGELPDALLAAGDSFEGRVKAHTAHVGSVLPPLAWLVVATVAMFLVAAMYAPLLQVVEAFS